MHEEQLTAIENWGNERHIVITNLLNVNTSLLKYLTRLKLILNENFQNFY